MRIKRQPVVLPIPFGDNVFHPGLDRRAGMQRFIVHRPVGLHIVPDQHRSRLRADADFQVREFSCPAVCNRIQKYHRSP